MRITRLIALIAATIGLVATIAGPASARSLAEARAYCNSVQRDSLCLFEHEGWNGRIMTSHSRINNLVDVGFNDMTTSYLNNSSSRFCMYQNKNTGFTNLGFRITVYAGAHSMNVGARYNDQISSVLRSDDPFIC